MRKLIHRHTISIANALEGLRWAFTTQPNFIVHAALSAVIIFLSLYFQITRYEFLVILFTIILGITGELLNTAIEAVTDLITKEWRKEAKIAKDVSAGMMLFIAFGSIAIAVYIFTPYFIELIQR